MTKILVFGQNKLPNISQKIQNLICTPYPNRNIEFMEKASNVRRPLPLNLFTVGFWGGRSEYSEETVTKLRKNDCLNMIKTKRCGDMPMTCDGENCFLDYKPTKKFAWLQTITLKGYRCSVSVRVIHGDDEDTKLFQAVDHPCRAKDLECLMSDSIIVWDSSLIHTCP
jgi:hypothetical protein